MHSQPPQIIYSEMPHLQTSSHYQPSPTRSIFSLCGDFYETIIFGDTAFKIYLLIGWCVGLAGIMGTERSDVAISVMFLIYLIAQIFGFFGVISNIKLIFAPYLLVMLLTLLINIACIFNIALIDGIPSYGTFSQKYWLLKKLNHLRFEDHIASLFVCFGLFLHSVFSILAVQVALIRIDDQKELQQQSRQQRREELRRQVMLYDRLISINHQAPRDDTIVANLDSPPKYTTLSSRSGKETPPPNYSQLGRGMRSPPLSEGFSKNISQPVFY